MPDFQAIFRDQGSEIEGELIPTNGLTATFGGCRSQVTGGNHQVKRRLGLDMRGEKWEATPTVYVW